MNRRRDPLSPASNRRSAPARIEALEPRLLLSAETPAGGLLSLQWQGRTVQAAAEEWIVRFADDVAAEADDVLGSLAEAGFAGAALTPLGRGGFAELHAPAASTAALAAWAETLAGIAYVEPNFALSLGDTALLGEPDDSRFDALWGLHNTGQTGGAPDADIDAPEAWDLATGSSGVVVAVIDTGVDADHADLAGNMWVNPGEIPGDGIDNDRNGYVDDVHGWDFGANDADPDDPNGHGTHVAGTIGAVGDNARGVAGVNWSVSIMSLKFLDASGAGYLSDAIEAIEYATMMRSRFGVNVVATNNSWGGGGYSTAMRDAIARAGDAGVLFVAAAGNGGGDGVGDDNDASPHYPSNYALDNVLAVAATDRNDRLAGFSNYGDVSVDLAAPGVGITSTFTGGRYTTYSGTSMATPHVAGVAALLAAYNADATAAEIRSAILDGADAIPSLSGRVATGGRLNARGALDALGEGPAPDPAPDPTPDPQPDPQPEPDPGPHEPNDTLEDAMRLPLQGRGSVSVSAEVGDGSHADADVDVYLLDVPAGTALAAEITARRNGSSLDSYLRVFDGAGRQIAANDDAEGLDSALQLDLPEGGTVYLAVSGYGNAGYDPTSAGSGSGGSTGRYSLSVALTESDPEPGDPSDPAEPGAYAAELVEPHFEDISFSGERAFDGYADDDLARLLTPDLDGWSFELYGHTYRSVYISSNGVISFLEPVGDYTNPTLADAPHTPAVAAFWDDLVIPGGWRGGLFWEVRGSGDDQRLIVQWNNVAFYGAWWQRVTFQAVLHEADGSVELNYLDLDAGGTEHTAGGSATVGIRGGAADELLQLTFNDAGSEYVASATSTLIRPVPPQDAPADPPADDPVDDPAPPPVELAFEHGRPATFTDADGEPVTVLLVGPGSGVVELTAEEGVDADRIALTGTTSASTLIVRVAGREGTGVGSIDVDGDLRSLIAPRLDLLGDVTVAGSLTYAQLDDVLAPATLTLAATGRTILRFDRVADLSVSAAGGITALLAAEWLDTDATPDTIAADHLTSLVVHGNRRDGAPGDFQADLDLAGGHYGASLRSAWVAGASTGDWTLAESAYVVRVAGDASGEWTFDGGANVLWIGGHAAMDIASADDLRVVQVGANATGDWTIHGDVLSLFVRGNAAGAWTVDGGVRSIYVGGEANVNVSAGPTRAVYVGGNAGGDWLLDGDAGNIVLRGDATGDWTIHGDVRVLRIDGEATGEWVIDGDVGVIRAGSTAPCFTARVAGDARSVLVLGNMSGQWSARSVGVLTVLGDLADAAVELTRGPDARRYALARATVLGWVRDSVLRSAGNVGWIVAGGTDNARLLAGVDAAVTALPESAEQFDALAAVRGLHVTGRVANADGYSVRATTVAAAEIGQVHLTGADPAAASGLAARRLDLLTHRTARSRYLWTRHRRRTPAPQLPGSWNARILE